MGRVGRKHFLLLSMALFFGLVSLPFGLMRLRRPGRPQQPAASEGAAAAARTPAARKHVPEPPALPLPLPPPPRTSTPAPTVHPRPKARVATPADRERQALQQQPAQVQCRRQVPAVVTVTDAPLSFAFPTSGRARTACYQPTTQVLTKLGWSLDHAAGAISFSKSSVVSPKRFLKCVFHCVFENREAGHAREQVGRPGQVSPRAILPVLVIPRPPLACDV